jgi:hypothetical protein
MKRAASTSGRSVGRANGWRGAICQGDARLKPVRNTPLTVIGDIEIIGRRLTMDGIDQIRLQLGERIANLGKRATRLSPLDIHEQMDAIRQVAAVNGFAALEGLAHRSAQLALLPGHRVAMGCCLERMGDALDSRQNTDTTSILAALAVRLH